MLDLILFTRDSTLRHEGYNPINNRRVLNCAPAKYILRCKSAPHMHKFDPRLVFGINLVETSSYDIL